MLDLVGTYKQAKIEYRGSRSSTSEEKTKLEGKCPTV
jgi:hypothetical protein